MIDWWTGGALQAGGTLVWGADPAVVAAAVVVGVLAWGVALLGPRLERVSAARRVAESVLWALAVVVLVAAIADPRLVQEEGRQEEGRLVVLVDGSASMAVQEGGRRRGDAVSEALAELQAEHSPLEVYTFDGSVHPGPPSDYTGRGTDLAVAFSTIADRHLGQQLRGVVVLTDGLDRGALRRELREAVESGQVTAELAPELPGPLTVVQVGSAEDLRDLAVEDVTSGGFAFLRTPFTLSARIRGRAGETVPVTLNREGRKLQQKSLTLDDNGSGTVDFEVTPRQVGRYAWEVSVPVDDDDAVPGNNAYPVVVRVVRERTRVLQVSGSPSYDQKFLRLFLKEDPSVDLVSFFILRTHEDFRAGWESRELSLIEFPYERLFTEDLDTFDLVVLQNFNYRPYFSIRSEKLLGNIAEYVRGGGALVMTGGDRSFDLGSYANTPIADVLPVELGVSGVKTDEAPFRPQLTQAGSVHPITRLGATPEESQAIWKRLPSMDGVNLTRGLTRGSAALLVHPGIRAGGEPAPVLAVREVGDGRTMALAVDASWRWSFSEAAEGRGNQAYLRLWKNALRWLVADPDDRRVVVTPGRENVLLGDEVKLTVQVRDAGYGPVEGAVVVGTVTAPGGEATELSLETDSNGQASTMYVADRRGAHRVELGVGSRASDRGSTVFAVSTRDPELVDIQPDRAFLEQLAALYGDRGRYIGPDERVRPLLDDGASRVVPERQETPLSNVPLVALLFGVLASAAWWIRRRSGGV